MNRAEACIKALAELMACFDTPASNAGLVVRLQTAMKAARAALAMPQWSEEVPDESGPYWVRFLNDDPNKPHRSGWLMEVYSAPTDGDWRVRHWNESHWSKRKDIPPGTRWQRISEPRAEG